MIKVIKKAFVVIGKEGSTLDGAGFIQKLWDDANGHFSEVAHLRRKIQTEILWEYGGPCPMVLTHLMPGKMSLAKACIWREECVIMVIPAGWTKWIIPGYEYIVVENHNGAFEDTIKQMNEEGMSLVGAVHDYTDPATGKGYMYFPIREI